MERNKTTRTSGIQATPLCSADGRKTARANARRSVPQARGSAKRKRRSGIVRGRPDRVEIISSSNRREHRHDLAPDSASQPACAEGDTKTSREALDRDELPAPHSAEARTGQELTIEPVSDGSARSARGSRLVRPARAVVGADAEAQVIVTLTPPMTRKG